MQRDPVFRSFLESAAADALEINARSRSARLVSDPRGGRPTDTYHLIFDGLHYLRRDARGRIAAARDPVVVRVSFPDDYLRCVDPGLAYRVIWLATRVFHPNLRDHHACLAGFAAGTRLRGIVEQLHALLSARAYEASEPLDPEAARFFAEHPERVGELRSAPLWLAPPAKVGRVRDGGSAREAS
jgi:hypothetical protein